jgi:type I restriction enzyme S subunit
VAIPEMRGGEIRLSDTRKISQEHFLEWTKKANPKPFDVVLSRRCNPGETAFVRPGMEFALGQNLVLLRADGNRVIPSFLRWLARCPQWWSQIDKFLNVGAVFDSLRCADVPKFRLLIPPLDEQQEIASLLGALDDKIELNRQTNETLEALARAIFKEWFVDCGPPRAKAEGREPYLAPELWELFPDVFDDEDKPEGWELSEIGKEVRAVGGATPSTNLPIFWETGEHNWSTPKDLSKLKSPVLLFTERKISNIGLEKISSGLLPVGTVLLSSRAPIGYLAIAETPTAVNQGFIAMVCDKRLTNLFVFFWCEQNLEYIKGIAGGSTFAEISKKVFRPIPIVVPANKCILAFDEIVRPLYNKIVSNTKENETLAQTRDLLLPQLMSGEIRLQDAERIVGEVV